MLNQLPFLLLNDKMIAGYFSHFRWGKHQNEFRCIYLIDIKTMNMQRIMCYDCCD